ncbi:MAG: hypothetical protein R3Y59_02165 [bacterium]
MKLKIYILLLSIYTISSTLYAQDNSLSFDANIGYEHTLTSGSNIHSEMVLDYTPLNWIEASAGIKISTKNINQLMAKGDFKWWTDDTRFIALRNQYLYSIYADDNLQSLSFGLAAVYDQEYFSIALGANYQFYTSFVNQSSSSRTYVWEPGITYDAKARIFPRSHIWNLEGEVTNCRDFVVERVYNPTFLLNGHYTFTLDDNSPLKLYSQAGFQPSGITHIAVNYYSFIFNIGVVCVF